MIDVPYIIINGCFVKNKKNQQRDKQLGGLKPAELHVLVQIIESNQASSPQKGSSEPKTRSFYARISDMSAWQGEAPLAPLFGEGVFLFQR